MAQIRKAEGQLEIKSNAVKFFNVWAHTLPKNYMDMCPDKISKVEIQGGTCHNVGTIIIWNYVAHGNCEVIKTKTVQRDDEKLVIAYETIDGDAIKKYYKSFNSKSQIIPKCETSILKFLIEYEKRNEDGPSADMYVQFVLSFAKDIDACLCSA